MSKPLYLFFRLSSATRHWLRNHIGRSGVLFLAALLFSAAIGIDTRQNTVFQFFTFLAVLGVVAFCFCLYFTAQVTVVRYLPEFVTAGESFRYRTVLENKGQKSLQNIEVFDDIEWHYPTYSEFCNFNALDEKGVRRFFMVQRWKRLIERGLTVRSERQLLENMNPGTSIEMWHQCTPLRRGVVRFGSVTFAKSDPFGLFRALSNIKCVDTLLVLPKRYPIPPVPLSGSRKYQPSGVTLASTVGESQEFLSMRDYRPGDPPRTIHWRSWAKTGKPMVKEFQDEYFSRHGLILDTFSDNCSDRCFEEAVSVAASLACTVADRDSLLDLLFVGNKAHCFTVGRSLGHSRQLLEILATVQPCSAESFAALPTLIQQRSDLLSSCICIFLAWDENRQKLVADILASGVPVLPLVISDHDDEKLQQDTSTEHSIAVHHLHPDRIEEGLAQI